MTPDEIAALEVRVANGITWLDQHDPGSVFHAWWQAGLTPRSPLPAQEAGRRAEWAEYFGRRQVWERLYARLDKADAERPRTVIDWQPEPTRP